MNNNGQASVLQVGLLSLRPTTTELYAIPTLDYAVTNVVDFPGAYSLDHVTIPVVNLGGRSVT